MMSEFWWGWIGAGATFVPFVVAAVGLVVMLVTGAAVLRRPQHAAGAHEPRPVAASGEVDRQEVSPAYKEMKTDLDRLKVARHKGQQDREYREFQDRVLIELAEISRLLTLVAELLQKLERRTAAD
jgi:hypothetical protein